MKELIIKGPTFYSQEDENLFFQAIYNLPNYIEVIGRGRELKISFDASISTKTRKEVEVLCRRWSTSICS